MALRTVGVKGNEERTLVAGGKFTDLYACWSPDGQRIVYSGALLDASGNRAGQSGIYIIGADGYGLKPETVIEEMHLLRVVDWK